jgi:hypothetical protein
MNDYKKMVEALRCKRDDCEGCDLAFFDKDEGWLCQYAAKDDDAADAIEALQAETERLTKENRELCLDRPELEEVGGKWVWRGPKRGEIVRCGECKWWHDSIRCGMYSEGMDTTPDWFCADGEREVQE